MLDDLAKETGGRVSKHEMSGPNGGRLISATNSAIERYLHSLKPSELSYLQAVQAGKTPWAPQSKPQWMALLTRAF